MPTASLKAKYLSQKLLLMKKVRNVLSATAFILQNSLSKIFLQKALEILLINTLRLRQEVKDILTKLDHQ